MEDSPAESRARSRAAGDECRSRGLERRLLGERLRDRRRLSTIPQICADWEIGLGYVIAAYGIVIGSLVVYAFRLYSERRKLTGQNERRPNAAERR